MKSKITTPLKTSMSQLVLYTYRDKENCSMHESGSPQVHANPSRSHSLLCDEALQKFAGFPVFFVWRTVSYGFICVVGIRHSVPIRETNRGKREYIQGFGIKMGKTYNWTTKYASLQWICLTIHSYMVPQRHRCPAGHPPSAARTCLVRYAGKSSMTVLVWKLYEACISISPCKQIRKGRHS